MIPLAIDGNTTVADIAAIKSALGIVSLTLEPRASGLFMAVSSLKMTASVQRCRISIMVRIAKAMSYADREPWSEDEILSVGAGLSAAVAMRRAIEKYARRIHERGLRAAS